MVWVNSAVVTCSSPKSNCWVPDDLLDGHPVEHASAGQPTRHFSEPAIAEVVLEERGEELVQSGRPGGPGHGHFLATRKPTVGHEVEVVVCVILMEVGEADGGDVAEWEYPSLPSQHAVLGAVPHVQDVVPASVLEHRAGARPFQAWLRVAGADRDDAEVGLVGIWRDGSGRTATWGTTATIVLRVHTRVSLCRVKSRLVILPSQYPAPLPPCATTGSLIKPYRWCRGGRGASRVRTARA